MEGAIAGPCGQLRGACQWRHGRQPELVAFLFVQRRADRPCWQLHHHAHRRGGWGLLHGVSPGHADDYEGDHERDRGGVERGVATYGTSSLGHRSHAVGAVYSGEGNFIGTTNYMFEVIDTPPVISPVTVERGTNSGVKVSVVALVGSVSDADGDPLSLAGVDGTSAHGGTVVLSNGWVFYTPPQGYAGADTFNYTITDGLSAPVQGTVTVDLQVDNGPSPNLAIVGGSGSYQVWGDGIPGRTYHIQYTTSVQPPDWVTIGTAAADTNGVFLFEDSGRGTAVFYRSVWP